jgi:hypothetical protein
MDLNKERIEFLNFECLKFRCFEIGTENESKRLVSLLWPCPL